MRRRAVAEESVEETATLPPDSAAGLLARLVVAAPAAGLAALLLGTAPYLPSALTVVGLVGLLTLLAIRFTIRRYAADRIACIYVAFVTTLWILWHAATHDSSPAWAIVGTAVAALALIAVPAVGRIAAIHVPVIGNLAGLKPAPDPWTRSRLFDLLALLAIALGAVITAAGLPSWLWALLALVVVARPGVALVWSVRRLLAARAIEQMIDAAVTDYGPEFYVYTARPDDASYQIHMWLPYLERTGRRFVIVARTNVAARAIIAGTSAPVITRRSLNDLDRLIVPSLRAVFYVNASSGNGAMVRYQQLTHVYLGHGDSDKPPSYNPTHAMYDKVFCAGPAAIDRYGAHGVDIPRSKFEIVGRPQVEAVRPASGSGPISTVLYAPTWRGHVAETLLYSLPQGEQIVRSLLARGLTVIFRPHPFSHDFPEDAAIVRRIDGLLAADAAASGRAHLFGAAAETERSIVECINTSDMMISDVSSVVSDYLFSGKPFALVAVPAPPEQFVQEFPVAAGSYVVDAQLANLGDVLDLMMGTDPRQPDRRAIRNYYLGDFPEVGYAQNFVDACIRVADGPLGEAGGVDDSVDDSRGRANGFFARARAQISRYGREIVLSGLAAASAVLGLVGALVPAAILGVAAVLGLLFVSRQAVRDRPALNRMVGTLVLPRAMVATAAIAWLIADPTSAAPTIVGVLALALLTTSTITGLALRFTWTGPGLGVRSLPGLAEPAFPRTPPGLAYVANTAALALVWLVLAMSLSAALIALPAVIAVVVSAVLVAVSLRRAGALDQSRAELEQRVAAYRPRFAVYFGSSMGADYQVGMWLPYFHRIGQPFVIITRTLGMLQAISELDPDVPVIFRPTLRSLEEVIVPTLTTTFYVNNAVRNTHFIERRELTHVWLNHGDSEKPACFNPVHAIYDKIYAAGQAGIDRYARHGVTIARSKFEIVGRPQVERISRARGPIASLDDVTVLYAPTWRGPYADSRVYSLPMGDRIVQGLLDRGVRVVFRAHPFNYRFPEATAAIQRIGRMLDSDRKSTGRAHLWGPAAESELTVEDCFNLSDAMISDVSAVVSDYLQSDKPFSIVSVGRVVKDLLGEVPAARAGYVLREDLSNLLEVLDNLLGADPLAGERATTRVYYLGDFPAGRYADGFLSAARALIEHPPTIDGQPTTEEKV
jgi:CDP-glycerol glycerophosphotransferase (TagB/SpsB family)